jgi:hypothetical protein
MNDPRRLRSAGGRELERLLLESVRDDRPSAGAQARTIAALGAGTAIGVSSVAGGAAAIAAPKAIAGTTALLLAKYFAIGAGTGIATLAVMHNITPSIAARETAPRPIATIAAEPSALRGSVVATHPEMPAALAGAPSMEAALAREPETMGASPFWAPPAAQEARPVSALVSAGKGRVARTLIPSITPGVGAAPTPATVSENPGMAALPASDVTASPAAVAAAASLASTSPPTLPAPPPASLLARQIAVLDQARRVLKSGDAASTIVMLDGYRMTFPAGDLMPEATLLRIEALLQLGQRSAAEQVASAFLANRASGAHSQRIRRLLSGGASQ